MLGCLMAKALHVCLHCMHFYSSMHSMTVTAAYQQEQRPCHSGLRCSLQAYSVTTLLYTFCNRRPL